jgi:tetratricopeptide (TPR) repeat protein
MKRNAENFELRDLSLLLFAAVAVMLFAIYGKAQTFEKIADETVVYLKAGTFGKPSVAKKTSRLALSQVRVHYKIVTTRAVETRDNGARVTVYLDGAMTHEDLQALTDEFYLTLRRKLSALGIEFVPWEEIAKTEYYNNREDATAEKNDINADGGNGQAWISYTANKGPVFYRYGVDQTKAFGSELLAFGKMKKIGKMSEALDADFATLDAVVDFTSIELAASKDTVWQDGTKYLKYGADYNIAAMMSVPQSYALFVNRKLGFDQYASKLPVGQRDFFSEKPYEDANKASYKTKTIFGDSKFAFTPVVIEAKRELYLAAARRALELYADIFVEKMRLVRGGIKPGKNDVAEKPADNTRLEDVNAGARKNNETTAVTTNEMTAAAEQAEREGKFQLAADYYTELIRKNPEGAYYYLKRGVLYLNNLNNKKAAVRDFDQAIKLNPSEPILYFNRGTAYLHQNDWKKAKKDFDAVISLVPDYVNAYLNRGIVNLNLKDTDAALNDFNTGIRLAPRLPNLYRARAIVYKSKGNMQLAQADELHAARLERGQ